MEAQKRLINEVSSEPQKAPPKRGAGPQVQKINQKSIQVGRFHQLQQVLFVNKKLQDGTVISAENQLVISALIMQRMVTREFVADIKIIIVNKNMINHT